jgi:AGZA family xanthine/uracil permease-like MFS transporter
MVVAGFYLFGVVRHIKLTFNLEAMPAFLTILLMPITGSISDGILTGLISYIILSYTYSFMRHIKERKERKEG